MSRKANRKCVLCGVKVKPGEKYCPACKAWEEAGNKPVFDLPKSSTSQVGQALGEIFK